MSLCNKQSILNRRVKKPSKSNIGNLQTEYEAEQRRLNAIRRRQDQRRDMQAKQLFGTKTEKNELKELQKADMYRQMMERRTKQQLERQREAKMNNDVAQYHRYQNELHQQRVNARKQYLLSLARQNQKLDQYRRQKKEIIALKDEADSEKQADFYARFGRNAL